MIKDELLKTNIRETLLLDFYGQLLSPKSFEIMDLFLNEDMGLTEIAQNLGVTRQAVYDTINRARKTLHSYEERLGIVSKFLLQKNHAEAALEYLDNMEYRLARNELEKILETI